VRVVITDDSAIAVERLQDLLSRQPGVLVVGTARNAAELGPLVARLEPDVVTLDLLLPDRTGLALIRDLALSAGVVVVSDSDPDSALARESLAQGARAFISKRDLANARGQAQLVQAVMRTTRTARPARIVAIAGSTGAMTALEAMVPELCTAPAAFLVLQHLPSERVAAFTAWLATLGLPSEVAEAGAPLREGGALVAPGDRHLCVLRGERVSLTNSPALAGHRPSATELFASLVDVAPQTTAIVLSGMGRDGADALPDFVAAGGTLIVQRPDTCAVPGMPAAALAAAPRAHRLSPAEIGMLVRARSGLRRHA
jgi:two-component system chemotaxis response regulator CheB